MIQITESESALYYDKNIKDAETKKKEIKKMSKGIITTIVETKIKILKAIGSSFLFASLIVLAVLMATG